MLKLKKKKEKNYLALCCGGYIFKTRDLISPRCFPVLGQGIA